MRLRRKQDRTLTNAELLDGLRALARNMTVTHTHTVRQERVPMPPSGLLLLKRDDGREFRTYIACGRLATTRVQIPMQAIRANASPAEHFYLEFQWES